jgi:8-oxo-dGTP pyrophosphatase MutT (NUDIX family)
MVLGMPADESILPRIVPSTTPVRDLVWRVVYRLAFPVACCWWWLRRARHEGALVAVYVGPAILLLRSSYRRAWNFPGGSVRPDETPETAARRELAEEIGIAAGELVGGRVVCGIWEGQRDRVHVFELHLAQELPPLRLDNREITGARLVSRDALRGMKLTGPVAAYLGMRAATPSESGDVATTE